MDAISTVFTVYGGGHDAMLKIAAILFIFTLLHQGAAWMIGSDRVQAIAGVDGSFPKFFGQFHPRLETPVRVNMLSGVVATIFCVLATQIVSGSAGAIFIVVLTIAVTTLLLSYLIILPSCRRLRRTHPDVVRPFRVPGGEVGITIATVLVFLWILFGSFVAVFPDVLERLFGVEYDFEDYWGVSQTTFEVFTLGTLAVIIGIAVGGYLWRRSRDGGTPLRDIAEAESA
jgi:amino acid transporter